MMNKIKGIYLLLKESSLKIRHSLFTGAYSYLRFFLYGIVRCDLSNTWNLTMMKICFIGKNNEWRWYNESRKIGS